ATFSPDIIVKMAEDMAARHFIGADPAHIESLFRKVYGTGYTARPDVSVMGVFSGLEMACWDITGKSLEKPVYELLGGKVHERLRTYTYIYPDDGNVYPVGPDPDHVYVNPERAAERAIHYLEQGFTALKFDPAGPFTVMDPGMPTLEELDRSEAFVRTLREAVGNRADLLFGTHGQFTPAGACRLARRLEPYDPLWLEEPVPPDNVEAMASVARYTSIPVATGERLCTKYEFANILKAGAAAILQMNLGRVGGLLEAKKIAAMAESFHAQIAPHLYCGPVVAAANIQIATCSPNFLILESIEDGRGFQAELVNYCLDWEDGYAIPSDAPGLGINFNETLAKQHPYDGSKLHLEMTSSVER
ncbi:MAG: galactonate dehydratase, partial [Candidatus Azotimanducaceae bacterium]